MEEEYDLLETNFRKQTFAEYYQTMDDVADIVDSLTLFNTDKPSAVPGGARFREQNAMKELWRT